MVATNQAGSSAPSPTVYATTFTQNTLVKANNNSTLNLPGSWTNNAVPGPSDSAQWDSTVTTPANCTNTLGASLSWNGIKVVNPSAAVNLNDSTYVLTLGANGVDMSAATVNLTLPKNVTANGNQTWFVRSGTLLQVSSGGANGILTGGGTVTLDGGGTVYLNQGGGIGFADGNSFAGFTGNWVIQGNTTAAVIRNGASAFGTGAAITLNGGRLATGEKSFQYGNWAWTNAINLQNGSISSLDNWNAPGSGRWLKLQGIISGDGNLIFTNTYPSSFNSADLGFILTANNTMSGTVTICPNTPLRVGGVPGADTSTGGGSGGTLGTAAVVNNGTLTFSRTNAWTFSNNISGIGTLRIGGGVSGVGNQVLTLGGANSGSGAVLVGAGTLLLSGSLGSGPVTVSSNATLGGNGFIAGPVTMTAGSTLKPGVSGPGTVALTISNSLNLAGTMVMAVNRTNTQPSARIAGLSTVTYGGTLVVTNLGPALQLGDSFALFSAGTYSNTFATLIPPSLGAGLGWDASQLSTDGTLTVVSNQPPTIAVQPRSLTVNAGNPAAFSVTAAGSAPLGYQWQKNGTNITGATTTTYALERVGANDAGSYSVTITNAFGSISSSNATLIVGAAPPDPATVYAWYAGDAGMSLAADNYSVTTWTNLGVAGTNSTYTQAGRNLTQLTGAPQKSYLRLTNGTAAGAITFAGADGIWAAKSAFGILSNACTIVTYARLHDATAQGFLFDCTSFTPGLLRAMVLSNSWRISAANNNGTATAPAPTNLWQLHAFVLSTNGGTPTFQHFLNGSPVGTVAVGGNGYLSGLMIGANVSQAAGVRADVAEFLVFTNALDTAARTNAENYLATKWSGVVADTNAPTPPVNEFVRVFTGGVDGYTCFRIPAIVTTMNGTVIAMSDGRIGSCGDIPTPLDLVIKRSFDNGLTWGPLQVVTDYGTVAGDVDTYPFYGLTNISRVSAGDAALLVDRTNGRIWTLYDNGGISGSRKIKLEMKYSDDDGATWSPRIDVEAQNPGIRPGYGEFLTGPGNGIQLTEGPNAGRLIFPVYTYGSPSASMVIYSDNHGVTWQRSTNSITNGGEIQVAELPGGELIASMRDNGFSWSGVRTFSRSSDGGQTWSAAYTDTISPPTIPDPQCQGNIFRLTTTNDSNASRLIHANAAHASSRVNMTLRISYDEGATWAVSNQVYAGGSAYSSVTRLATGEIGLLFEKDPYGNLDYARRSISQITGGSDSLPPYTVWAGEHFTPAQLMNLAISGPDADPDGDGYNNQQEFTAGTDPLNQSSALRLEATPVFSNTNALILQFLAVSNTTYSVVHRTNLFAGVWQRYLDVAARPSNALIQVPALLTNDLDAFRLVTPQMP